MTARIEPCLQEETCRYHIYFAAHRLLGQALFTQTPFSFGGTEPFICEFDRQSACIAHLGRNGPNALGLGALLARKRVRQATKQQLGLPIFQQRAKRLGMRLDLIGGKHAHGRSDTFVWVAHGDPNAFFSYVQRKNPHIQEGQNPQALPRITSLTAVAYKTSNE